MSEVHGIKDELDLAPSVISRESRTFRQRARAGARSWVPVAMAAMTVAGVSWPFAVGPFHGGVGIWIVPLATPFVVVWLARYLRKVSKMPFRDGFPYTGGDDGEGIIFLGNCRDSGQECWFSKSDVTTHMIVFGSTGSGKTIFLLGLFYQALLCGSGVMFVDGKADNSVWWMVYAIARRLGREDDVLLINYLTGGMKSKTEDPEWRTTGIEARRTNSTNPIADVGAEQARSLLVGLMPDAGTDGMWKGRASALLGAVLRVLCYMRDTEEISGLDLEVVRSWLPLDRVLELAYRGDKIGSAEPLPGVVNFPEHVRQGVVKYVIEIPGFNLDKVQAKRAEVKEVDPVTGRVVVRTVRKYDRIDPKALEQHGYLTMQLTEVFEQMSETYGHIFLGRQGEVDFRDVVFNRRILFVMLPSLEVDPDRLQSLGKFVVAGVRSALAPALGDTVEGERKSVIERKPTNAKVPFFLILDEYGYYAVEGFAVVAAQARSLGVSVIFAGQDYPSFKRASEAEGAATLANTNITIVQKIEDTEETFKVIESRGGEGKISQIQNFENRDGVIGSLRVRGERDAHVQLMQRVNSRDLVSQGVGEGHVIFGDRIVRANLCYVAPERMSQSLRRAQVNEFVIVDSPTIEEQRGFWLQYAGLRKAPGRVFDEGGEAVGVAHEGVSVMNLSWLLNDVQDALGRTGSGLVASAMYAVGLMAHRQAARAEAGLSSDAGFASLYGDEAPVVLEEDEAPPFEPVEEAAEAMDGLDALAGESASPSRAAEALGGYKRSRAGPPRVVMPGAAERMGDVPSAGEGVRREPEVDREERAGMYERLHAQINRGDAIDPDAVRADVLRNAEGGRREGTAVRRDAREPVAEPVGQASARVVEPGAGRVRTEAAQARESALHRLVKRLDQPGAEGARAAHDEAVGAAKDYSARPGGFPKVDGPAASAFDRSKLADAVAAIPGGSSAGSKALVAEWSQRQTGVVDED